MNSKAFRYLVKGAEGAVVASGTVYLAKQASKWANNRLASNTKSSEPMTDEEVDEELLAEDELLGEDDFELPDKDHSSAANSMKRHTQRRRIRTRVFDDVTIRVKFQFGTAQDVIDEIESGDYSIVHEDLKDRLENAVGKSGNNTVILSLSDHELAALYDVGVGNVRGKLKVV